MLNNDKNQDIKKELQNKAHQTREAVKKELLDILSDFFDGNIPDNIKQDIKDLDKSWSEFIDENDLSKIKSIRPYLVKDAENYLQKLRKKLLKKEDPVTATIKQLEKEYKSPDTEKITRSTEKPKFKFKLDDKAKKELLAETKLKETKKSSEQNEDKNKSNILTVEKKILIQNQNLN